MNILLTGGAGYIGSHTSVILSQAGYEVILFDNFYNSQRSVLEKLEAIIGKKLHFIEGDIRNHSLVLKTLLKYSIDVVVHLAAFKIVDESVRVPLQYYSNNMCGMINLLEAMDKANIKNFVFSSSAAIYGEPKYLPIDEDHPTNPTSPYGRTKLQAEQILRDLSHSNQGWKILCLRYFNPVGAHESGLLGETTAQMPTNLMPYISKVAAKKLPFVNVYGADYSTSDGTGVRDYIHVMDIARGHLCALESLSGLEAFEIFNLGVGFGHSVLEVIKTYEKVNGVNIPYKMLGRREADVGCSYASSIKAEQILGWKALCDLEVICADAHRWINGLDLKPNKN